MNHGAMVVLAVGSDGIGFGVQQPMARIMGVTAGFLPSKGDMPSRAHPHPLRIRSISYQ